MDSVFNLHYFFSAVIYSLLGLFIFVMGFFAFDKITPYHLWKELIENKNVALAIVVGAVSIGLSLIISSAIHS